MRTQSGVGSGLTQEEALLWKLPKVSNREAIRVCDVGVQIPCDVHPQAVKPIIVWAD